MPFQGTRELVRAQPYRTQVTFVQRSVANNGVLTAVFDVSIVTTDRNQLVGGVGAGLGLASVGPWLDCTVFADQIGQVSITLSVDNGGLFHSIPGSPFAVVANTLLIAAERLAIPARFVSVQYQNLSGGAAATVDFGAYVGSA